MSRRKKKVVVFTIFIVFSISLSNIQVQGAEPIAQLVLKVEGGSVRADYAWFIAKYLREIGIEVESKTVEKYNFEGLLKLTHDYDMGIVEFSEDARSPDMREFFTEEGSMNMFGFDTHIPYCNQSEIMQNEGVTITDLEVRQQHYYDWQQLVLDKIVPLLPLYSPRQYVAVWANTVGYEGRWGLSDSFPYMSYDGYHDGQVSFNEFNVHNDQWTELNPLYIDDESSELIGDFIFEPIIQFSPDLAPLKTGLVEDWEQIDEFHYKFYMRPNVYWNPSFNITERSANSPSLSSIPSNELMVGLKGEYSDGTNQQVSAKDAVFTFLLLSNPLIVDDTLKHRWISDCYIDPLDEFSFHLEIDADPATNTTEQYVDFWTKLSLPILPEFYLNSTNPTVTYTDSGISCVGLYPNITDSDEWRCYSQSAFGCGKYMLDYSTYNLISVLQKSPYWFGVGAIDGTTGMEPFVDTINSYVIESEKEILSLFKAGKLDWVSITSWPIERKQMQAHPIYDVQTFITATYSYLFFNLQRPFLGGENNFIYLDEPGKEEYTRGVAIRKAICYAIDRDEINKVLHSGEYLIAHSIIYPFIAFYYYNDIIKYNYDIWAAWEWLGAAGYDVSQKPTTTIYGCGPQYRSSQTNIISYPAAIILVSVFSLIVWRYRRKTSTGNKG